jgi:hypothetical protein
LERLELAAALTSKRLALKAVSVGAKYLNHLLSLPRVTAVRETTHKGVIQLAEDFAAV